MLGRTYDTQNCSAARALELVGERWSLLIIRDALFAGHARFGDFQRSLGVASNILTARLDSFVAAGLMERRRYSEHPEHYEYLLTGKGRDLAPVIVALTRLGRPARRTQRAADHLRAHRLWQRDPSADPLRRLRRTGPQYRHRGTARPGPAAPVPAGRPGGGPPVKQPGRAESAGRPARRRGRAGAFGRGPQP